MGNSILDEDSEYPATGSAMSQGSTSKGRRQNSQQHPSAMYSISYVIKLAAAGC